MSDVAMMPGGAPGGGKPVATTKAVDNPFGYEPWGRKKAAIWLISIAVALIGISIAGGNVAIVFCLLIALMLTGIPVSIALGLTVLMFLFLLTAVPVEAVALKLFTGIEKFEIMAIPFFILAGNFLTHGGVARRMIKFATTLVGHWHGGLALAGIIACAMFALVCGSSVATVVAILIVDKVGRKPMLLGGSAGMTVMLAIMAVAFSQAVAAPGADPSDAPTLPGVWAPIALVAANLYVVAFAVSWGPVVWVLLSEMFPNRLRAAAVGVATAANWIANFAVSETFPRFSSANLSLTYGGYAVMAILSLLVVLKWVPETKGRTLEDAG